MTQTTTLDLNGDGVISRGEYAQTKLQRAFRKLDLNGDEKLTLAEWKQTDQSPEAEKNFGALDENGDQYISVAEFLKLAPKHSNLDQVVANMDTNEDTNLSEDEIAQEPAVRLFSFPF
ncbi:MAG: EF-hand domain-containing protein [Spartobacteria bacterium]